MLWPFTPWDRPARDGAALDRWLPPGARRLEHHALEVPGTPAAAVAAVQALTLRELPAVRALFALRGLRSDPGTTLRGFFSAAPFTILADDPAGHEVVFAVGAPPARWGRVQRSVATGGAPAFRDAAAGLPFVAVGCFGAGTAASGARLWTETWVSTAGLPAGAAFTAYWIAIGPFSAWTRRMFLRGARDRLRRGQRPAAGPGISPAPPR